MRKFHFAENGNPDGFPHDFGFDILDPAWLSLDPMPNGKGSLDCCYCVHFNAMGYPDVHDEERLCRFHEAIVPKAKIPSNNRICGNFEPSELYYGHNPSRFFPH